MFSELPPKLRELLDGLDRIGTGQEGNKTAEPQGKRSFIPDTPSPEGEGFEDRVCREMGASLFRYKAIVPFTFFRDVKAWTHMRHPSDPVAAAVEIRQFVISFVYYFCTSTGSARTPIPQQPLLMARSRMSEIVKGNRTLEVRLDSFVPRWKEGAAPATTDWMPEARKVSIPPPLLARLEKDVSEILAWRGVDEMDTGAD